MIATRNQMYGAVLHEVVNHGAGVKLKRIADKAGHYSIDGVSRLLIKYSKRKRSPWRFTFSEADMEALVNDCVQTGLFGDSYICLVCGKKAICSLGVSEWEKVLHPCGDAVQTITVRHSKGCQLEVIGTNGALDTKIPISRFPRRLLGE
jgi:hypothetical protein